MIQFVLSALFSGVLKATQDGVEVFSWMPLYDVLDLAAARIELEDKPIDPKLSRCLRSWASRLRRVCGVKPTPFMASSEAQAGARTA